MATKRKPLVQVNGELTELPVGDAIESTAIGARVYSTASAQTVATATEAALNFNAEQFDSDTCHDNSTNPNRLTCKTAGKYLITGAIRYQSNATGYRGASLRVNGGTYIGLAGSQAANGQVTQITVVTIYDLAVNDYIELIAYQESGSTLNLEVVGTAVPSLGFIRIGA